MKKKISIVVIIILIIVIALLTSLIFINKKDFNKSQKSLKNKITNLTNKNKDLQEKLKNAQKELETSKNRNCTYTRTYRYIEDYDYIGEYLGNKYIVVDQFQNNIPMILTYNTSLIDINLEKGKYYEITFESGVSHGIEAKYQITNIASTDKVGLGQVQEECKIS